MPKAKFDPTTDFKLPLMPKEMWIRCAIRMLDLFGTAHLYYEVRLTSYNSEEGELLISKLLVSRLRNGGDYAQSEPRLGRMVISELQPYSTSYLGRLGVSQTASPRQKSVVMGQLRRELKERITAAWRSERKP